jgi:hypothetical protein
MRSPASDGGIARTDGSTWSRRFAGSEHELAAPIFEKRHDYVNNRGRNSNYNQRSGQQEQQFKWTNKKGKHNIAFAPEVVLK